MCSNHIYILDILARVNVNLDGRRELMQEIDAVELDEGPIGIDVDNGTNNESNLSTFDAVRTVTDRSFKTVARLRKVDATFKDLFDLFI